MAVPLVGLNLRTPLHKHTKYFMKIREHDHTHSVYTKCGDCLMLGVNIPGYTECGNCGSSNTWQLVPPCCIEAVCVE